MIRKTYGVSGLMDWTTQIKAGRGTVSVHFTGGALTAYGVTPAKYSTSNPFFQNVIENSEQFKSGRIELLGKIEVPDDAAEKARKARAKMSVMQQQQAQQNAQNTSEVPAETTVMDEQNDNHEEELAGQEEEQVKDDAQTEEQAEDNGVSKIEVADKNEAVEYLKEHFSEKCYTATNLRTKTAFEAACKECNIEFVFIA